MDIHKPKPWHGIREFLKEYAIIVVGVLTALGAEQLVEAWQWRVRTDQTQAAMRHEIADDDGPQAFARAAISPCLSQRLDAMEAAIQARQPEARIASLASEYHPLAVTWDDETWKAANASGAVSHFDKVNFDRWFGVFVTIGWFEKDQAAEHDLIDVLRSGLHGNGALTDAQADRAIRAVQGLRRANRDTTKRAQYLLMRASALNARVHAPAGVLTDLRTVYGSCVSSSLPAEKPLLGQIDLY